MKWGILALIVSLWGAAGCASTASSPAVAASGDDQATWTALTNQLPGTWEASIEGRVITVSYRLTARSSVLLETWMPGTAAETVTTYHLDHGRLMLTHYCGQGNQPSLRLTGNSDGMLQFERFGATDLDPDESALLELGLSVERDRLQRREIYASGDEQERTDLRFTRVAPSPTLAAGNAAR